MAKHVLQIAAARNRIEDFLRERHAGRRARDVHDRTLPADGDRLLHGAELQREIDARREADGQPQLVANKRRESSELRLQTIGAGGQVDELIGPCRIGHLDELADLQLEDWSA